MQDIRFLTREEIVERFDVDYINELMHYSDKKFPYKKSKIISKPLIEDISERYNITFSNEKVNHGGIVSIVEKKEESETVQIPKELFNQFIQIMEQYNKKQE